MIRLYTIGVCILLMAIIANGIVIKLGVKSWYDFINLLSEFGISTLKKINVIDYLWLFIIYPLVLASGYWIGDKIYNLLFN